MALSRRVLNLAFMAGLCLHGCSDSVTPLRVEMSFTATNTADHILVVEGRTNLPAGAPLKAELRTRDGRVMLRDTAVVSHQSFFFDFNLEQLTGLSLYEVHVTFDPEGSPLGVRRVTGLWGEALEGPGVSVVNSRRVVQRDLEVILSATVKSQDWEGRDFESMEVSERVRLTHQLEGLLEESPDDRQAKLALARAYIAANPRELASGSRAHMYLKEVVNGKVEDKLSAQAQTYLSQIEAQEAKAEKAREQRDKIARGEKYRNQTQVLPGRSIGAFNLGAPYRLLQRHFKLATPPDFSNPEKPAVLRPTNFPGLEFTFNSRGRRIQSIRTTSERYKLPEGLGVGSLLQELQSAYGQEAVPTPAFTYQTTRADGYAIYRGKVTAEGLEFEIRREVNPTFALPVDKVSAITVFAPDHDAEPAEPTADLGPAPTPEPTTSSEPGPNL